MSRPTRRLLGRILLLGVLGLGLLQVGCTSGTVTVGVGVGVAGPYYGGYPGGYGGVWVGRPIGGGW